MPISINENGTIKSLSAKMTGLGIEGIERIEDFVITTSIANTAFNDVPLGRPLNEYKYLLILPSYNSQYDPGSAANTWYTGIALIPVRNAHYNTKTPHYSFACSGAGYLSSTLTIFAEDMTSTTITVSMSNISQRKVGVILDGVY